MPKDGDIRSFFPSTQSSKNSEPVVEKVPVERTPDRDPSDDDGDEHASEEESEYEECGSGEEEESSVGSEGRQIVEEANRLLRMELPAELDEVEEGAPPWWLDRFQPVVEQEREARGSDCSGVSY
jgi:hypothetical protein